MISMMNFLTSGATALLLFTSVAVVADELELVRADYGRAEKRIDVTEAVRDKTAYLPGTFLAVEAGNWLLPEKTPDPAPGQQKELRLFYRNTEGEQCCSVKEYQRRLITVPGITPGTELKIERAFWGGRLHLERGYAAGENHSGNRQNHSG